MSNLNAEQFKAEMFTTAADLAEKMGFTEESDLGNIYDDEDIIIATGMSILTGKIDIDSGSMGGYRYEHYMLNGETLWSKTYDFTEDGWESEPRISDFLPEDTIIYKE